MHSQYAPLPVMDVAQASVARAGSEQADPVLAAQEIYRSLNTVSPACIVFYCCTSFPLEILSRELQRYFAHTTVIGCTSAGEITPLGFRQHAVSAFALSNEFFAVESVLIEDLAAFTPSDAEVLVANMLGSLKNHAVTENSLNKQCFAMTLLDGLSVREELVIDALNMALQDIPLVGGSAGDDQHFVDTRVCYNGKFYSNAAVFMLINTRCRFNVFSYHHLTPQDDKLVVTQVAPGQRVVQEFNAEPAALEYCRINNLKLEELCSEVFAMHPLAVQIGDNLYIRSIQRVNDDLSLTFFCAIDAGIVLTKMQSSGLLAHSTQIFNELKDSVGDLELVIGFDCIHRRVENTMQGLIEDMSALYRQHNVIGFNSYGEQIDGLHLNHTFTGVALGAPDEQTCAASQRD